MKKWLSLFIFCSFSLFGKEPIARKVIALYNSLQSEDVWYDEVLQYAAMPIEYSGLVIHYHDMQKGLPDISHDPTVKGVVMWDLEEISKKESEKLLDWSIKALESKKKVVILGTTPGEQAEEIPRVIAKRKKFWRLMGLKTDEDWQYDTFGTTFLCNTPFFCNFERNYLGKLPSYLKLWPLNEQTKVQVVAKKGEEAPSVIAMVSDAGGYIAAGYALYKAYYNERDYIQWFINPFTFFREAFGSESIPKPDVTTINGRRAYYSHIDGDGWNSISLITGYREDKEISAKVILEEIIAPHPGLPVTVAPVAADLDPTWAGLKKSQEVAQTLFELGHVELGSHTYSHPFDWRFFKNYNPADEKPYLAKFPHKTWNETSFFDQISEYIEEADGEHTENLEEEFHYPKKIGKGYSIPRAFANQKFSIEKEVAGSAEFIGKFSEKNKQVKIIQWSGNCLPFERALELAYTNSLKNINGGDTRFDSEFDSYGWVRPLGKNVGTYLQVFSSMSNENLYTDLWTKRFWGFRRLPHTFIHTEIPIRLRPMNLYYHMYSGEKLAALKALKQNIEYINSQEIIPIETSHYADLVNNYYQTVITPLSTKQWKISNRGRLQTIRFDKALFKKVDFENSKGLIGQRHYQGSLYLFLDAKESEPVIALMENPDYYKIPSANLPYLISSRWEIENLVTSSLSSWSFTARGYGEGEMIWYVPENGEYRVTSNGKELFLIGTETHQLEFSLPLNTLKSFDIQVEQVNRE